MKIVNSVKIQSFSWFFFSSTNLIKQSSLNLLYRSSLTNLKIIINVFFLLLIWLKARVLYYINNWVYSTNHRRIAINYFWFVILAGIVGMVLATLIRLELAYPGVGVFAGDSLQYLSLASAHGVVMVFFMIMPLIFGAFANFLLPTQLGVHDVAFPRLNSAAFWFLPAGLIMLAQLVCVDRRYQRMNCFNIREVEALLKRRFFIDLVDHTNFTHLIDQTMIKLKYKLNDDVVLFNHSQLLYNLGPGSFPSQHSFFHPFETYAGVKFYNNSSIDFKILSHFSSLYTNTNLFNSPTKSLPFFSNDFFFVSGLNTSQSFFNLIDDIFSLLKITCVAFITQCYTFFYFIYIYLHFLYLHFDKDTLKDVYTFFYQWVIINIKNIQPFENWFTTSRYFFSNYNYTLPSTSLSSTHHLLVDFRNRNQIISYTSSIDFEHLMISKKLEKIVYFKNHQPVVDNPSSLKSYNYSGNNLFNIYINLLTEFILYLPHFLLALFKNWYNFKQFAMELSNFCNFLVVWLFPTFFNPSLFILNWKIFSYFHLSQLFPNTFSPFNFEFEFFQLKYELQLLYSSLSYHFQQPLFVMNLLFDNLQIFSVLVKNIFSNFSPSFKWNFFHSPLSFNLNFLVFQQRISSSVNLNRTIPLNFQTHLTKIKPTFSESSLSPRYVRFNDPIFKYDYKSGDYFSKLYREVYQFLFPTILNITMGLKTSSWYYSPALSENSILSNLTFLTNVNSSTYLTSNAYSPLINFQTYLSFLTKETEYFCQRFSSLYSINQKFYNLFLTSSMQQRIYSNWRQLKFTREAWRCKLLAARHQKTLFKRYVNEDGVFWSIERNAKDLLPGWAMITPFSSRTRFTAIGKVDIGLMGVLLVLNSSLISGVNFLVTYRYLSTINNRKMRDARTFFTEGIIVTSWMMIFANPMLAIGIIMLLSDRHWQTSFFDYSGGGDTVLFQHMFWFFGHPEVYIIIIPVFGFTNSLLSYYLKKRVSARASLLYSMYTIAFLGFFVWGHHMYMVGLAHTTRMLFSTLTVMISVPAATKLMHWCVTMVNSAFTVELPFIFILTFVFFLVSGGISGMYVAHTGMDVLFHDTFYVIAHFHVMLAGAAMFGCFGAFYFYFPAIFGVKYSRIYAYLHYTYYLIGQLLTVVPMFWLGYAGMPRRVLDYPAAFGGWHSLVSAGHMLSVAGLIAFFFMIFDSIRQGKAVIRNNFGINRFNTRLNFYLYEISRLSYLQKKNLNLFKNFNFFNKIFKSSQIKNYESLETVLFSYSFVRKS